MHPCPTRCLTPGIRADRLLVSLGVPSDMVVEVSPFTLDQEYIELAEGFASDFKRFFLRGLAAVLPTLLTLMVIVYVFSFVNTYIGQYINTGVLSIIKQFWVDADPSTGAGLSPQSIDTIWSRYFWWVGFVLAIVAIYIFGRFVGSFLGRFVWRIIERLLLSIPIIGAIYPHIKQVTDFIFADKKIEFSRVVAVEYPRKGIWSIGLVTGAGMRTLQESTDDALLTIFIPSSPTPVTGYTITVRRDEVVELAMNVDDALRFTISGGVIIPPSQQLSDFEIKKKGRYGALPAPETMKTKETTE